MSNLNGSCEQLKGQLVAEQQSHQEDVDQVSTTEHYNDMICIAMVTRYTAQFTASASIRTM